MTLDMGHGTYDMGAGQERDIYLFFHLSLFFGNHGTVFVKRAIISDSGRNERAPGKVQEGGRG